MQKIIEKQDDIIQVYYNQSEIYTDMGHEIVAGLLDELASLKSQLAEAGEEKKLTDEQIQQYVTDRFSDSHLLPEIIAFRAIKYYRLGLPPMNGNKAVLD